MITGFNTDVNHNDRVFHVQTEDKGLDNPVVESLIYCRGEIITSRTTSYADIATGDGFTEDDVLHLMEAQHQAQIRDIFNGRYDTEGPKPFGHSVMTNRSLDEVVAAYLCEHLSLEPIRIEPVDDQVLTEGTRPTLRMKVLERDSSRPVSRAYVAIRLVSTQEPPRELFTASSDPDGFVEASFDLPEIPGADTAILCSAEVAGETAELRLMVRKARRR